MIIAAVEEKMLYCPKCQETYDDGSQRFCNNDGGRLIPAQTSPKPSAASGGVFTSLIGKIEPPTSNDEKLAALPRFVNSEHSNLPVYEVPSKNRRFQDEPEVELELEPPILQSNRNNKPEISVQTSTPEILELFVETAPKVNNSETGDRQTNSGEAEIIEAPPANLKNEITILPILDAETEKEKDEILDLGEVDSARFEAETNDDILPVIGDIYHAPREEKQAAAKIETAPETSKILEGRTSDSSDLAWTRRSPEPPKTNGTSWLLFSLLGLAALVLGLWGIWTYFLNRPAQTEVVKQPEIAVQNQPTIQTAPPIAPQNSAVSANEMGEIPPLPRQIAQPSNSVFFQNSKQEAKGDLLRNFLGFTLYYPKDWKTNEVAAAEKAGTRGKFLDISRDHENGTPIEKMLVSYYESKGTFKADSENFSTLVKETNETLKKIVPNYQMLSEGEIKINGDWKAYEIKFQGGGETANGEKLNLWGRRLFIPTALQGVRSGYEITMFATSLSTEVKSVDDVGVKGELAAILKTFEPNQNF